MTNYQTPAEVARILGVTTQRVRDMDDVLKPIRIGKIQMRLYRPDVVERVRKERASK